MAETRQIGNLKIHFLGDNAAQLKSLFDRSYSGTDSSSSSGSESFRGAMSETARTFRNIYVGGALGDLKDQPGFDNAGFDPNSVFTQSTTGYGKASDAQTYFIVVTGKPHTLLQDGRSFVGSTDLVLIHELLHPTQLIRDLTGGGVGVMSELNTQMREQRIAQELGKIPGQDFPDVIDTGVPYTVKLNEPGAQPYTVELGDPTLSINPINFEDTFGHPFDGSPSDIILLKAALIEGSIDGWGEYVSPSGSDRYNAAFDSSDNKIVMSANELDRSVSIVRRGEIKQISQNNNDGSRKDWLFDPDKTHPYGELEITEDSTGKVTNVQFKLDNDTGTRSTNGSLVDLSVIGQVFGSSIGRILAPGNQFGQLLGGTVGGLIGQKLAQNFLTSLSFDASKATNADFATFSGLDVASAAAGSVASFLIAEIGTKLGLQGYGAQLFNTGAGAFTGSILNTVIQKGGLHVLAQEATWATAFATAEGAVGGVVGGILAQNLVHAESKEGAIGGQLLGAVGSALGISFVALQAITGILGFVIPGVGSFFGTILGTMLGDAIAGDPGAPKAYHDVQILGSDTHFTGRLVGTDDHGNAEVSRKMSAEVVTIANNFLDAIDGAGIFYPGKLMIGYNDGAGPYDYLAGWFPNGTGAAPRFTDPNDAIQEGVRELLMQTLVIGGDLLAKRAQQAFIAGSHPDPYDNPTDFSDLIHLSGDLRTAQDYEIYLDNREAINALMAANPESAFTAGWIATFARVNDLGLNHTGPTDLLGGLVGFLDSVNKAGLSAAAANASVKLDSTGKAVVEVRVANGTEVPGVLSVFANQISQSSDATGTTVQFTFNNGLGGNTLLFGGNLLLKRAHQAFINGPHNAKRLALRRCRGKSRHASRASLPAFLVLERSARNTRISRVARIRQHCP